MSPTIVVVIGMIAPAPMARMRPRVSGTAWSVTDGARSTDVTGDSLSAHISVWRMTLVDTVRGPVESASLGPTLMHEHVFVLTADVQQNHDEWDEEEGVADAVTKLRALREA